MDLCPVSLLLRSYPATGLSSPAAAPLSAYPEKKKKSHMIVSKKRKISRLGGGDKEGREVGDSEKKKIIKGWIFYDKPMNY